MNIQTDYRPNDIRDVRARMTGRPARTYRRVPGLVPTRSVGQSAPNPWRMS
jgi:hypothetical protein